MLEKVYREGRFLFDRPGAVCDIFTRSITMAWQTNANKDQTMLKLIPLSSARKTRGIATTYRSAKNNKFGTCPAHCPMNVTQAGAREIDADYLDAVLAAVPKNGKSFTYTHFDWSQWADKTGPGKTTVNYSTESLTAAAAASRNVPTVTVVTENDWNGKKTTHADSIKVVRCPAEYRENFGCAHCGNGSPLCARQDRDFIVGFTAHGSQKKLAADASTPGGCYANNGHVEIHWRATSTQDQVNETDADKVTRFAKSLPPGSILRHHVAGDIGLQS